MSDVNELFGRIEALERENARLAARGRLAWRLSALAAAVAAAFLLLGNWRQGQAEEKKGKDVEAEKYLLQHDGKTRAAWWMGPNGPKFDLYDEKGKLRATLALTAKGDPVLAFFNAGGGQQMALASDAKETALTLNDAKGVARVVLSGADAARVLELRDEAGKTRLRLADGKDGGGLTLIDDKGKTRGSLVIEKGGPVLRLTEYDGKSLFQKP